MLQCIYRKSHSKFQNLQELPGSVETTTGAADHHPALHCNISDQVQYRLRTESRQNRSVLEKPKLRDSLKTFATLSSISYVQNCFLGLSRASEIILGPSKNFWQSLESHKYINSPHTVTLGNWDVVARCHRTIPEWNNLTDTWIKSLLPVTRNCLHVTGILYNMQIVCEAYHRYLILSNLAERHTTSICWKTTLWCQHYIAMNFYQWTKLNCMCIYSKTILKRMSSFKNNQVYTRCGCCVTKYTYNTTIVYKYIQHSWKTLLRSFDYKKYDS